MSKKTKTLKPKKVDLLELSSSKNARLLKEVKEKLQQMLMEARFWQSLAKTERITINGEKIDFANSGFKELTCSKLAAH